VPLFYDTDCIWLLISNGSIINELVKDLKADHSGRAGLRHEMSSPARTLGTWIRIPLKAWMSVWFILCLC
jgi:hypothetical protein